MSKSILLVEDNPDIRVLIQIILNRFIQNDTVLYEAGDGEEGLRIALENQPDLILMDLALPKMDGFELMDILKRDPATNAIPIIVLSAQVQKKTEARALQAGAIGFITKPIDIPNFVATVKTFFV